MPGIINVKDAPYNAAGDGQMAFDASITVGQNVVNSSTANFQPGDVGKTIWVNDPSSGNTLLTPTVITVRDSATQVHTTGNALGTATSQVVVWGTDDTTAFQDAFTAAIAGMSLVIVTANPGTIYAPSGIYLVSGRIYNNLGTAAAVVGPSFMGDGRTRTSLLMSPSIPIPGDGSAVLIQNIGYGASFTGFSVSGCYKNFALNNDQDIIRITQASSFRVDDVSMGAMGAAINSSAFSVRGSGQFKISQLTIQGGLGASVSSMTALRFVQASGLCEQVFPSNFPNNLLVTDNEGRSPTTGPLIWVSGGVDETSGEIPCKITNGGQLNIIGAFLYGSPTSTIYVDGTSKLWITDCNVGRFQHESSGGGGALVTDAGAQVFSAGTTWRGCTGTPFFMDNDGQFVDMGGNEYRFYTAADTFTYKTPEECFSGHLPVVNGSYSPYNQRP